MRTGVFAGRLGPSGDRAGHGPQGGGGEALRGSPGTTWRIASTEMSDPAVRRRFPWQATSGARGFTEADDGPVGDARSRVEGITSGGGVPTGSDRSSTPGACPCADRNLAEGSGGGAAAEVRTRRAGSQEGLPQRGRILEEVSSTRDWRVVSSKIRMAWRVAASMTLWRAQS